jgi:hypothetical protein
MAERKYSEEEMAAIFERATQAQPGAGRQLSSGSGLTLGELQEIGREVGIAPEAIERAALSMDRSEQPVARRFLGLPIGVGKTVDLGRRLSEEEWERLVVDLRDTFDARGNVRSDGSFRQWTNGNLQVLLEPTPTGHRLRLRTVRGNSRALMTAGIGLLGAAAATLVAAAIGSGIGHFRALAGPAFLSVMGLGAFGAGALQVPGWARLRLSQMEGVVARLASRSPESKALPGDAK